MPEPQQIIAGNAYVNGGEVNFTNLNNHVNLAKLDVGAITGQVDATAVALADTILLQQSGALKEASVSLVKNAMSLSDYVKRDGTAGLTTGQLNLYNTNQLAALNAVSLGHLEANFLKNSGSQALAGSLSILSGTNSLVNLQTTGLQLLTTNQLVTLSRDPINALEAVPKQYVDASAFKATAIFTGRFANAIPLNGTYSATANSVTFTTAVPHGFLVGHKLTAECAKTGGAGVIFANTTLFQVTTVQSNTVFTATPSIAVGVTTGNITAIRQCLIHNQSSANQIANIVYLGPADSGAYAVNLTNQFEVDNILPVISPSALIFPEVPVAYTPWGIVVELDFLTVGGGNGTTAIANCQIPRQNTALGSTTTNSFVFTTANLASGFATTDCGYRTGIVIY
tara:strand:+ start:133 stop:1323 length:1191 start_codon:yes stop_codon:yes gene_type:complete